MKALGFGATQRVVHRCLLAAQRRRVPFVTRLGATFLTGKAETTFGSFDLDPVLVEALHESGFQQPSQIQVDSSPGCTLGVTKRAGTRNRAANEGQRRRFSC